MSNFLKVEEVERTVKVIVVGNGGVGKTSLIRRFVDGVFDENYKQTIGTLFKEKQMYVKHGKQNITLHLWDTAGQEKFDSLTRRYYRGASFCVLVFSTTDRHSFLSIEKWYKKVIDECCGGKRDSRNLCILLVQNKIDLISKSKISPDEAEQLARKLGVKFFRICVKNNFYVDEVFKDITKYYIKYSDRLESRDSQGNRKSIDPIFDLFSEDNQEYDDTDEEDGEDAVDSFDLSEIDDEENGVFNHSEDEEEESDDFDGKIITPSKIKSSKKKKVALVEEEEEDDDDDDDDEDEDEDEGEFGGEVMNLDDRERGEGRDDGFTDDKFPALHVVGSKKIQKPKKKKILGFGYASKKKKREKKKLTKKNEEEDDEKVEKVVQKKKNSFFVDTDSEEDEEEEMEVKKKIQKKKRVKKSKKKSKKKKKKKFEDEDEDYDDDPEIFSLKQKARENYNSEDGKKGGNKNPPQNCKYA